MNKIVREYLIAVAREDNTYVFYKQLIEENSLNIDPDTPKGQKELKKLLIDISTFEHEHNRPMLTAVAINKRDKDQGPGFYELAESFGYGKKSDLRKSEWGRKEAARVREFWKDENNYRQFASTGSPTASSLARLFEKLIHAEEFAWCGEWRDSYIDFVRDVKRLQANIAAHTELPIDSNRLYTNLSEPIRSYENFILKWLKENRNGISSLGQSVLSGENFTTIIKDSGFKVIAKLIISNPTFSNYKIFMEWWYNNEKISNRPLLINRAVAACLPERLSSTVDWPKFWFVVNILKKYGFKLDDNSERNWFTANEQLTDWLDGELKHELEKISDNKLEQQIWRNIFVWLVYEKYRGKQPLPANELIRRDPPEDGYDEMPQSKVIFEGRDVDFEKQAREQKELGDAGEELVKQHEIKELQNRNMHAKAKLVRIAKPGEGFDVYSFDEKGNVKYIEVKTTTGSWKNRFYLTRHELNFMRENKSSFSLYRVYNFDEENNSGEFFELKGNVENQVIKEPTVFEVVVKRRNFET